MVRLVANGSEWVTEHLRPLRRGNVLVEVIVEGRAEAAGISFGHYKDFLAPLAGEHGERRLQLEVDADENTWAFSVDGVLMEPQWTDAAVFSVDDLFDGTLALKARNPETVSFHNLAIRQFDSSPRVSVVITCYRFAHRLRVALTSWCRQSLPSGALEVVVVNPASPDTTHEVVAAMATQYPDVRLRELRVDAAMALNKGRMINRALDVVRGEWVWLTDADCVFPPGAAARLLSRAPRADALVYCERRHLTESVTDALLAGRLDPEADFEALAVDHERSGSVEPWGYTQIFHRANLIWVRYSESHEHYAHSDGQFAEQWRAGGLGRVLLDGLVCLHLVHPFSWWGTDQQL
jgi:Glycosyl transferase family 2